MQKTANMIAERRKDRFCIRKQEGSRSYRRWLHVDEGGLHQREKLRPFGEEAGKGVQSYAGRYGQLGASGQGYIDGMPASISTS